MRRERVASLLEKEISNIIVQKIADPRIGFTTISKVLLSADLKEATVYFSSLGDKSETLTVLNGAKGYIRNILAQRIRIRFMPDLCFKIDNSYDYGEKIDTLLEEISKDNKE